MIRARTKVPREVGERKEGLSLPSVAEGVGDEEEVVLWGGLEHREDDA